MQRVLVLSHNKQPLMPCYPARARELLKMGKAVVFQRFPFTILLKDREEGDTQATQLKVDPGSKTTGIALVADFKRGKRLIWAADLGHRGPKIRQSLLSRRGIRSSRRQRKTRYRDARFNNRCRPQGWLLPSLNSRVANILTWVSRLSRTCPITSLSQELVQFDAQLMQNAEISGIEYQQGELAGYEVREYLLEKWGRQCIYCGGMNLPLQIEHIVPKSRGGSNRVSNLTLSCHLCNQRKGNQTAAEFGYPDVQRQAKMSLSNAAAVNSTRAALYNGLQKTGLSLEVGTGGRTKFNRVSQGYPKTHWIDAACIGESGTNVFLNADHRSLMIVATGHGTRQICRVDKYGFPSRYRLRQKQHFGFQTGDMVKANVPSGKFAGKHIGRVACRATGQFDIRTTIGKIAGIPHRYCCIVHHSDGYEYQKG